MHDLRLEDRALISDAVIGYATALDRRDWVLLRVLMTPVVHLDYSDFDPSLDLSMPADEWVARVTEGLSGFDGTQHLSTNHVHTFDEDSAVCVSQMQAAHFLIEGNETARSDIYGYYTTGLVKSGNNWLIKSVKLTITATVGDTEVYARAVQRHLESQQ